MGGGKGGVVVGRWRRKEGRVVEDKEVGSIERWVE